MRQKSIQSAKRFEKYNRIFKNRFYFLIGGMLVLIALVGVELFKLQIKNADHYTTLADENRLRLMAVAPPRGAIYDRDGHAIAANQPIYQLEIVPALIDDIEKTLADLKPLIEISQPALSQVRQKLKELPPSRSIVLKRKLSDSELALFSIDQHLFPGVEITAQLGRHYPDGKLFAHAVGYIGRIDKKDLRSIDRKEYRASQYIGKVGIEGYYEKLLRGESGIRTIEINSQGRIIRVIDEEGTIPGNDLMLTLDYDLQRAADQGLGDYRGAAVALDPRNGEILALVSKPSYNPNWFFQGSEDFDYERLLQDPGLLLFNRAVKGQYPPGSTIKPIIALAGLEHRTISADSYLYAGPYYITPNFTRRFYDWRKEGHGLVNLHTSIVQSCDVFFYDLAYRTGIDRLSPMLKQFGLGRLSGVDLRGEASGLAPSRRWKKEYYRHNWLPEETVITGVGQGYTLATPLQLALATALIANRGRAIRPHLLKAVRAGVNQPWKKKEARVSAPDLDIQERHWSIIGDAMRDTVHSPNGTAYNIGRDAPYIMAGKTGTAQVVSRKQGEKRHLDREQEVKESQRDHALFVVYAPADSPSIAVAVIVENVGSGSRYAAPIARQILDVYFADRQADDKALTDI